jgi:Toprim domain
MPALTQAATGTVGERGGAWRPARRARRCGDGIGGQTLAIELAVPDSERKCDEIRSLVAHIVALKADVVGNRIEKLIDRHKCAVDLALEQTKLPVVLFDRAALSTSGLKSLVLPAHITAIIIAADNDENGAGEIAANTAAQRWIAEGRSVRIAMRKRAGADFDDVLRGAAVASITEAIPLPHEQQAHDADCVAAFGRRWLREAAEVLARFGIPAPPVYEPQPPAQIPYALPTSRPESEGSRMSRADAILSACPSANAGITRHASQTAR